MDVPLGRQRAVGGYACVPVHRSKRYAIKAVKGQPDDPNVKPHTSSSVEKRGKEGSVYGLPPGSLKPVAVSKPFSAFHVPVKRETVGDLSCLSSATLQA